MTRDPVRATVAAAMAVLVLGCLSGCVGPAFTDEAWQDKTGLTVSDALGHVQTARIAVAAAAHGDTTQPYLSIVVGDAETGVSTVASTYAGVQPPDRASDLIRQRVGAVLQRAVGILGTLRIAVRREAPMPHLVGLAAPLKRIARVLTRLKARYP